MPFEGLDCFPAAGRERAMKIGQFRVVPARLGMTQQIEAPHRASRPFEPLLRRAGGGAVSTPTTPIGRGGLRLSGGPPPRHADQTVPCAVRRWRTALGRGDAARHRWGRQRPAEGSLVRIIVVGGTGSIGTAVVEHLSARHDVVVAGRRSGDVQVDITSPDSVLSMYRRIGSFDALACAAGEAHFGPFATVTEDELALGVHSKLLGQMRLVLLGRSLISDGGSFTLMSGYLFDDPIPEAASFAVANGGVEGFVRSAALSLERRVRINAVSPGLAQDSYGQFGDFNPGRAPVPMRQIASAFRRSVEGWRTGEIIQAW